MEPNLKALLARIADPANEQDLFEAIREIAKLNNSGQIDDRSWGAFLRSIREELSWVFDLGDQAECWALAAVLTEEFVVHPENLTDRAIALRREVFQHVWAMLDANVIMPEESDPHGVMFVLGIARILQPGTDEFQLITEMSVRQNLGPQTMAKANEVWQANMPPKKQA